MKAQILVILFIFISLISCEENNYYSEDENGDKGKIVGKIIQSKSQAVVVASQVDEIASTVISASDGSFEIGNLPIGNYELMVTADNYRIYTLNNVMVQGSGNTYVGNIDLSSTPDLVSTYYPSDLAEIVYNNNSSRLSISITFTHPMDRESVENAFSTNPPTEGIFHWGQYTVEPSRLYYTDSYSMNWGYEVDATISTYSKVSSFTYQVAQKDCFIDTTYTVMLSTEAKDTSDNYLRFPLEFSFSTIQSSTTQNAILSSPSHGDIDVDLIQSQGIYITFPRNMDAESTEAAVEFKPQTEVIYLWPSPNQLTIYTGGVLMAETMYEITLDSTAKDADGVKLGVPFNFSFETASVNVIWSSPQNGEVFVDESDDIRFSFNTYMQLSSVQRAFTIDPPVSGTLDWYSNSKTRMEFNPSGDLQPNTKYTVTIGAAAKDLNGTPLKEPYVISFVTRPE